LAAFCAISFACAAAEAAEALALDAASFACAPIDEPEALAFDAASFECPVANEAAFCSSLLRLDPIDPNEEDPGIKEEKGDIEVPLGPCCLSSLTSLSS
jgi:hypothetical protein